MRKEERNYFTVTEKIVHVSISPYVHVHKNTQMHQDLEVGIMFYFNDNYLNTNSKFFLCTIEIAGKQ